MRILLCTNAFENITNGPAKFANLILTIHEVYPEYEVHVLTEDITNTNNHLVHPLKLFIPLFFKPLGQIIRMFKYHNEAMRIREEEFKFDLLVYNNAFIGLWSAICFPKTVGMINDYSNAHATLYNVFARKSPFKRFVFKQLEFLSTLFLKKVIVNSDFMTRELNTIYSIPTSKIARLYKSIEAPSQTKSIQALIEPVKILFVKTDYQTGGLLDLFEALKNVTFEYELIVVGPRPNRLLELQKIANALSLNCVFYSQKTPLEVHSLMLESDIFCVPSHKEALGVANIEAMVRGLVVVSTRVGGIPEVLDGGNNGWLVPPSDFKALCNALTECVTNDELRMRKIKRAMDFSSRFSKGNMFKEFIEITASVVHE
jgi:colanic acid/amylovoran biosynthesis glycosyltransferase